MTKEELEAQIERLNNRINSLTEWDSYAERLQSEYDDLIAQYNKLLKESKDD